MLISKCKCNCKNSPVILEKQLCHYRNLHKKYLFNFPLTLCLSALHQSSAIAKSKTAIFYNLIIQSTIANAAALVLTWRQF